MWTSVLPRCGYPRRAMLGHRLVGRLERADQSLAPVPVLVLNDWIGDTSTWDPAEPYLDTDRFTYVLADLRGYGRSREQTGAYTLAEAAADVLALADELGLARFVLVGHSMSTLLALHLAQTAPARIGALVLLTPPPPSGFGADDATVAALQGLARGDDEIRARGLARVLGDELSVGFRRFKAERWRAAADPEAVAGYVPMFARDGLPNLQAPVAAPVLVITGERDTPPMRQAAVTTALTPLCARLEVVPFTECGHYPMQEMPPRLVAVLERFLARTTGASPCI